MLTKQLIYSNACHLKSLRLMGTYNPPLDYGSSDLPVINTPQKMIQRLDKLRGRKLWNRNAAKPNTRGPLVISCQRKSYNFRRGENFDKETDFFKLSSCGWKNRKRIGDSFSLMSYADNPSLQSEDPVTFHHLGLNDHLCERLRDLGYDTPTHIQRLAIPPFLRGENVICAAETGSGKTLSYLLPAVERITHLKTVLTGQSADQYLGNPHTVVISPNRELTEQVMNVASSVTSSTEVVAECVVGGSTPRSELKKFLDSPADILITTPGILKKMLAARCVRKSNLQSIIIDESDTLLDDSFLPDIHDILDRFQVSLSEGIVESNNPFLAGIQLALVSATMPRDLHRAIGHIIPVESMTKVATKDLHHLMPHVQQKFHRINPDSKPENLIPILKKNLEKKQVSLVFVKSSKTCFYLKRLLTDNGIPSLYLNGELSAQERDGVFSKFKEGYCDILVATDIASRGLDTTNVHHVINYDFPGYLSDYIHRAGRVGRVGTKHSGHVTSFVAHKWDVEILWKIEMAARMGVQLDAVNANIKRKLERRAGSDYLTIERMS